MVGDLITRITGDTIQISGVVANFLPSLVSSILLFGFYFGALFLISHLLSYIFLIFSPLYYFIFLVERKMLPPLVKKERAALSNVTNSANEYILNLENLKGLSATSSIRKVYEGAIYNFYNASKRMVNSLIKYSGASSYMKAIMPFIILTVSFFFYTINLVSIGSAITFFFISGQAYAPLSSISGQLSSYASGIAR
jgi:ABC-type multidrug transport system fused ATPase/permease subunit